MLKPQSYKGWASFNLTLELYGSIKRAQTPNLFTDMAICITLNKNNNHMCHRQQRTLGNPRIHEVEQRDLP